MLQTRFYGNNAHRLSRKSVTKTVTQHNKTSLMTTYQWHSKFLNVINTRKICMKRGHSSKYKQFIPPQAFLAHPSYGTTRKMTWHCTTCYACVSVSVYSADLWCKTKLQVTGGVLFDLNGSCLCSHCLHCQDNQQVEQWNFNNMYASVMGIVTQLLYWSGHSGTQ